MLSSSGLKWNHVKNWLCAHVIIAAFMSNMGRLTKNDLEVAGHVLVCRLIILRGTDYHRPWNPIFILVITWFQAQCYCIMHILHIGCSSLKSKFVIVIMVINLLRSWVIEETLILWGILIPFEQYEKKLQRANQSATGGLDPATLFSQVNNLITIANQILSGSVLRAAVLSLTNEMSIGIIWCQFWIFFLKLR